MLAHLDSARLWRRIEALSAFTEPNRPWTRRAFTPLHDASRAWLRAEMEAAGLRVALDAAGNLVGRRPGTRADAAPLVTGSHCDTVVAGGRFDGIIGVLAGIEVAHALQDASVTLEHPFEVVDFLSEEPSDYGISCVGSRGAVGMLDEAMLACTRADGETLAQGMRRIGANPGLLLPPARLAGGTAAFVELHIEQGPVLEARQIPIGVVSHIVGIRRVQIDIVGQPDHAGTTPMDLRRDALVGASRLIDAAYQRASALSGQPHYVVATVGRIEISPNAPNAVPGKAVLTLEVRSDSDAVLDTFPEALLADYSGALAQVRVTASMRALSRSHPTACSPMIMDAITQSAGQLGYATLTMPSGAGHDAAYMACSGPMGMVFIPCLNGRSHCPEEWIEPEQLLDGTRVLAATLMGLDQALGG